MGWLQIVFYIIMNAPKFISIINSVVALINGMPKSEADALKVKLTDAIGHHKATGDESELEKVCTGVGCPSALK